MGKGTLVLTYNVCWRDDEKAEINEYHKNPHTVNRYIPMHLCID